MRALKGLRGWGQFDATFETTLGSTPDATGRPTLSLDASARRVYVKNGGSDANSGLSDALAKATLAAGYAALRSSSGDWLMVDKNSTFAEGFGNLPVRAGLSVAFPTVVTTYDATDPSNAAKFRIGTFGYASNPTTDVITMVGNHPSIYFENGRCLKPIPTQSSPGNDWGVSLLATSSATAGVMFFDWTMRAMNSYVQGDNLGGYDLAYELTGNTTLGSANITGVSLVGTPSPQTPVFGQKINGYGPLSGIQELATVVSYSAGTLVMSLPATATATGMRANFNAPMYYWKGFYLRCCAISYANGSGHACGFFVGTTDGWSVEDSVIFHNGYTGNRNDLANIVMNKTATASATVTVTFGGNGAGTATATTTSGNATLTNVTLLSGYVYASGSITGVSVTGTGIQASTFIATMDLTISPDGFKHGLYCATNAINGKVKRNLIVQNSSHGLQMRGGGQVSDNVFFKNAINCTVGSGDFYNVSRPYGVTLAGGYNEILGAEDIDAGTSRAFGLVMCNLTPASSFDRNIIANRKTTAGQPFNYQPFEVFAGFDQPSWANMSNSIVYGWGNAVTLAAFLADIGSNPFPAQVFGALLNNVTDGDTTWNGVGTSSGNVTSGSFPNPTRDLDDYAVSQGYADAAAYMAFAIANPVIKHGALVEAYIQAGFGH